MQKWEYHEVVRKQKVVKLFVWAINGEILEDPKKPSIEFFPYLKELGQDGWELIWINESIFFFKRPIE